MDGLAERAGLGKGTVFRRFGTRAGIFQALLDDDEKIFQQQVLSGPPPLGPGADPLDRLIAYGRARAGFMVSHRDIARAALDCSQPIPVGRQAPMSQIHIRVLLAQLRLGPIDLDMLATQLAAALGRPRAPLPVLRRASRRRRGRTSNRPGLARPRRTRLPLVTRCTATIGTAHAARHPACGSAACEEVEVGLGQVGRVLQRDVMTGRRDDHAADVAGHVRELFGYFLSEIGLRADRQDRAADRVERDAGGSVRRRSGGRGTSPRCP